MKNSEHDLFGFYETMIEYYTGRDASLLTDDQLAMKLAHLSKIRMMEKNDELLKRLQ